ncbi:Protein ECERIFERUM 1 [Platanthera guangdongensis]|uniref:aldehyde oxygenase (deformylating) n=1 Tax=Platanthera guangdongensis TaxID=2320717 RepID=A0ABR2N082_9ASPA
MASRPGLLTDWPWKKLGSFKYVMISPWVIHCVYLLATTKEGGKQVSPTLFIILPSLLLRVLHNQIWISISRLQTARSPRLIVDKSLDFDQVDRETNWDDQVLFNGIIFYVVYLLIPAAQNLPLWRTDGAIMTVLLHAGPVEFLYYWFHRVLHHHFLYSRYHSHHHASVVTEPITSVIHPFAEHIVYFLLFSIPLLSTVFAWKASIVQLIGYIAYIDFMNNMGHCNFELVPKWMFSIFPPLKYIMYTPSFHSLHHTQFRTNYSLFMPFYDYLYNTMDKSSDEVYESSLKRKKETIDVVHLTHPTTLQSIYHLRPGIASLGI